MSRPDEAAWNTRRVPNGQHTVEAAIVVDGRVARAVKVEVRVAN